MSKLQELYDGWKNKLTPAEDLDPFILKIAKARMSVCNTCTWNSEHPSTKPLPGRPDHHCTKCWCNLDAKTKSLTSACPFNKWTAAVKDD